MQFLASRRVSEADGSVFVREVDNPVGLLV